MQLDHKKVSHRSSRSWRELSEAADPKMRSVLIVDDEYDSRRALEILLQLHGFQVTAAAGGEEALAVLHERTFDVILTDWMMPVVSGAEVISRVRADRLAEGVPIIVLTAAFEAVRSAAPQGVRVIGKPLEFRALLQTLNEIVPQ